MSGAKLETYIILCQKHDLLPGLKVRHPQVKESAGSWLPTGPVRPPLTWKRKTPPTHLHLHGLEPSDSAWFPDTSSSLMVLWSSAKWLWKTVASTPVLPSMGRTETSDGSSSEFWVRCSGRVEWVGDWGP